MLVPHKMPYQVFDSFLISPSVPYSTHFNRSSHIFQHSASQLGTLKSLKNLSLPKIDK